MKKCLEAALWVDDAFHAPFPSSFKINAWDFGRISKPCGSRPKRKKLPRSAKSSGRIPWSGAPKSASAA